MRNKIISFFYLGVKEDVTVSDKQTKRVKWFYFFGLPLFVVYEEITEVTNGK